MAEKVNLLRRFSLSGEHWCPKEVGELNGQEVKIVKLLGPFTWHHHENADELFLVVKGVFGWSFGTATSGWKRVI